MSDAQKIIYNKEEILLIDTLKIQCIIKINIF